MNENILPIGIILTGTAFVIMMAYRTIAKPFMKIEKNE